MNFDCTRYKHEIGAKIVTTSMSGSGGVICSFDVQGWGYPNATNTDDR